MREFIYDFGIYICAWVASLILVGIGLSAVYLVMGLIKGMLNG